MTEITNPLNDGPHEDEEEGADYMEFSHRACDCCNTYLGGSRYRITILEESEV